MRATDIPVKDLVADIQSGKLRLPAMQRRYVWTGTRVRDLLDSLYRGYPSGAILVWETDKEMPTRDFQIGQQASPFATRMLLLDGQQRCTSLSAVIRGEPVLVRNRKRPIDILFNIGHPEGPPADVVEVDDDGPNNGEEEDDEDDGDQETLQERLRQRTFVVAAKSLASDRRWIRVSDIFDDEKSDADLLEGLVESMKDPRFKKYTSRLQKIRQIRNYSYRMHVLESDLTYEEVAEIFVRVNSLGVKLRGSDLALALITSRWPESLELFERFQEKCENETWFSLDLGLIVRALVVFATHQARFKRAGTIPVAELKVAWEKAQQGLLFAINFMRANARIEDESLLSSPLFLITVGYFGMKRGLRVSPTEEADLRRWLYVANMRGAYSGSSETRLETDLTILERGGGVADLLSVVERQFGRLHLEPGDLVGRTQRNPLFSITFLALRARGAKDWRSQIAISLAHQGRQHSIEAHHIHPKAHLKKNGYEQAAINEIANMAFVSGSTNRSISATPASKYLPELVEKYGTSALEAHCVPLDPELWKIENYPKFLEARRALLAAAINDFLEKDAGREAAVDVAALIKRGEDEHTEFKSSARWDYRESKPNKVLENVIVKTVAGFLNCRGGSLLIGVADDGEVLGLDADYKTLTKLPDSDGYQQFLMTLLSNGVGKVPTSASLSISFHTLAGKEVCLLRVSKSAEPVYVADNGQKRFFVRAQNTTQELDVEQANAYARTTWPK